MAPLSIQTYVVGPVQTNCYFAINDDTKEVLIIDPGASAKQLAEKVKEQGLKPVAILLTHGHFDHATGAGELAQLLHIKIYAQEKEKETLENPQLNLSGWQGSELVFYADTGTYGGRLLLLFPISEHVIQRGQPLSDFYWKD